MDPDPDIDAITIGHDTRTRAEWLGQIGEKIADRDSLSAVARAIYRAQIEALR
jgi:hypothetical protein